MSSEALKICEKVKIIGIVDYHGDKNAYQNFIKSKDFSLNSINAFANKQKILPSIIIGRLQKDKYLKWSDYSDQIKKYEIM